MPVQYKRCANAHAVNGQISCGKVIKLWITLGKVCTYDRQFNSIKLKALNTHCHAMCISGTDISHQDENLRELSPASYLQHSEGAR